MENETVDIKAYSETVEGGKYIVGENYVNANGEILGKVKEAKPKTEPAKTEK